MIFIAGGYGISIAAPVSKCMQQNPAKLLRSKMTLLHLLKVSPHYFCITVRTRLKHGLSPAKTAENP
ncbi:hypothetical protein HXV84_03705 [Pseudomonas amygdali pv. morsprunorum]|nr:hypothetical protein [Pseudomonas amygdali pv. morsprunorum]